jgi:hypothetical protein
MALISAADRAAWLTAAANGPGGKGWWADAISRNDANAMAFHLAGGDDCQVTSAEGKAFVAYTTQLLNRYEAETGLPRTSTVVTQTQPGPVEIAAGGAVRALAESQRPGIDPIWLIAAGIAVVLLVMK